MGWHGEWSCMGWQGERRECGVGRQSERCWSRQLRWRWHRLWLRRARHCRQLHLRDIQRGLVQLLRLHRILYLPRWHVFELREHGIVFRGKLGWEVENGRLKRLLRLRDDDRGQKCSCGNDERDVLHCQQSHGGMTGVGFREMTTTTPPFCGGTRFAHFVPPACDPSRRVVRKHNKKPISVSEHFLNE